MNDTRRTWKHRLPPHLVMGFIALAVLSLPTLVLLVMQAWQSGGALAGLLLAAACLVAAATCVLAPLTVEHLADRPR